MSTSLSATSLPATSASSAPAARVTADARVDAPAAKKPTRAEIEHPEKALVDATRPFCVEDVARSWRETLITLWALVFAIAVAAAAPQLWIRIPASIVAGLVIVRGFILYHDHQHNALLRFSPLGRALFWAYGILVLTPPTVWRQTHNYHHAHNSKIVGSHVGSYPILSLDLWEKATPSQRLMYRITRHPLNVFFGYFTVFGFGMCVSPFLRRPLGNWDSMFSLVLHVAIVVSTGLFAGWDVAFFAVVLPLFVACALGGYLFYAQHNFEGMIVQPRHEWSYGRAALESSSYMEMSPVMHWFTGNIGYHHVHHLNPRIPFYNLPQTMAAIPELQTPGTTSLSPSEIARCFSLKLWDPEKNRMVGYPS